MHKMKRPDAQHAVLAIGVLWMATAVCYGGQPNILWVMADDVGWSDTSNSRTNLGNPSDYYETDSTQVHYG